MVLVFGTICLDRIHLIPKFPEPGGYVEVSFETEMLGGEAANTTLAIRELGGDAQLVGNPIGNDYSGDTLASFAIAHGLPQMERIEQFDTPVCDIFVTSDAERTMLGRGFAMLDKAKMHIPNFQGADWVTAEPNMKDTSRKVIRAAKEAGKKTYLMDFIADNDFEIVRGCDYWQSSTDWVGNRGDKTYNKEWAHKHSQAHGCTTIITDGALGFVVCEPSKDPRYYPSFPCEKNVDGTGAGDLFRAGMLFGLDNDFELRECLLIAASAACLACQSLGATANLPTIEQVHSLISKIQEVANQY